jgi:hypothetical protein
MTLREHLKARVLRLSAPSLPITIVLLIMITQGHPSFLQNVLVLVVLGAYLAGYFVYMRRAPCPRCAAPLKNAALNWGSKRQPVACCPGCGLGMDEQVVESRPL